MEDGPLSLARRCFTDRVSTLSTLILILLQSLLLFLHDNGPPKSLVVSAVNINIERTTTKPAATNRRRIIQQQQGEDNNDVWLFQQDTTYDVITTASSNNNNNNNNNNKTATLLRFLYRTSDFISTDNNRTKAFLMDGETCNTPIPKEDLEVWNVSLSRPMLIGPSEDDETNDTSGSLTTTTTTNGYHDWIVDMNVYDVTLNTTFCLLIGLLNPPTPSSMAAEDETVSESIRTQTTVIHPLTGHPTTIAANRYEQYEQDPFLYLVNWQNFLINLIVPQLQEDGDNSILQPHLVEVTDFERPGLFIVPKPNTYFCDEFNRELDPHPLYVEGSIIRICVEPPSSNNDDDELISIESLTFEGYTRTDKDTNEGLASSPTATQVGIRNGQPAGNSLTTLECTPYLCVIQSLLLSKFYTSNVEVVATGYSTIRTTITIESSDDDENQDDDEERLVTMSSRFKLEFKTLLDITDLTASPSSMPTVAPPLSSTDFNDSSSSSATSFLISRTVTVVTMMNLIGSQLFLSY